MLLFEFLTFSIKLKSVYAFGFSICLSVHSLTLVNVLQMSQNLYRLFIFDVVWTNGWSTDMHKVHLKLQVTHCTL